MRLNQKKLAMLRSFALCAALGATWPGMAQPLPVVDAYKPGHAMNHGAMQPMNQAQAKVMPLIDGVARKVDHKGGKITLQHGEIASVKMPAMTMGYRVKQPQQLESIQPGSKVRFMMEKMGDDYIVTHIEPAR
jgi:Cu/Ag efflux protein CusF